ncbi:Clp protease N-terminal domain-containing protein [Leifsonia sp. C5G2]|uniref:Clp protease N-terminal domain-containing protein n=1 Tax=Leifsonia sp. C5G2 TaxID=2735269 RepID=UPI0015851B17|nr:Clp protease N-terminal domain-containing protein [Leifsonia sp. C5G2]NUU07473.1 hypothetical protein [Leifsonia sp. C5G2]
MSDIPPGSVSNLPGQPLSRTLRPIVIRSIVEAQERHSPAVEAEHLLLALSRDGSAPLREALASVGFDHDGLAAALDAERAASLRVAGVSPLPAERLLAAPSLTRPRWGASAREALTRAHRIAGAHHRQRMDQLQLLAALLGLELGTVPRTVALAGVDPRALLASARRTS